jgi:drug/metabolite transporter (DMT)-like permease
LGLPIEELLIREQPRTAIGIPSVDNAQSGNRQSQSAIDHPQSAMFRLSRLDFLLLLMTVIWGTNYSIVKHAFREIDPQAFNAGRMTIASAVFLVLIVAARRLRTRASIVFTPAPLTRSDWKWLIGLGIVGHFLYQCLFIGGLARTSVANSSLMLGATPVVIALITAALGNDRIGPLHWAGAALSVAGIYVVVGAGAQLGGPHMTGDLMMAAAVFCWATYTIAARRLMERHSPVGVTGISMIVGSVLYVVLFNARIRATDWTAVSAATWLAILYSALFALCIAYTIWYAAVREIGSARTSVYSNLVPLVAMLTAIIFLGEPVVPTKLAGAAAVLIGVALTRSGRAQTVIPAEQ